MLIRFIVDSSDFLKVLSDREHEDFIVLRRDNGFFKNSRALKEHFTAYDNGLFYEIPLNDNTIIYTDDETMLNYAPYINGEYQIEFKFPECGEFIPIMKLHPNLRRENDLTAMFHKGIFHDDFNEYFYDTEWCDVSFAD